MKFDKGVVAKIVFRRDPCTTFYADNTADVVCIIDEKLPNHFTDFGFPLSCNIGSWCELACVDDVYEDEYVTVEIVEE